MIRFVGLKSLKLRCSSFIRISSVTMLTPVAKFLTISLVVNLFAHSLGSLHHIQDDIFTLPRYKVVLTNEKISNSQVQAKEVESSSNSIIMTSSSGQPFSCIIPDVQIEQERREREKEEQAKEDTEQDINNTIERGLELLQPLGANCMRFYAPTAQYWTYEYCHNRYVRQYHVERTQDGKIEKEVETQSYYLGKYPGISDGEGDKQNDKALSPKKSPKFSEQRLHTSMVKTRDQRHLLVQHWKDGSICDKTQKPRTIEIQFYCDPHGHDHVASFEELTTCHYRIMIATPRLCEEMNLSHRYHTESHKIECRPIVSDNLLDQEKSRNLLQAQQDTTDDQALSNEAESAVEVDLGTEKEEIQKLLDSVVSKEAKGDDKLLGLISDLTDQITKLRAQMNTLPNENRGQRAEISLFTLDENGNIIPGVDFNQLIVNNQKKQEPEKSYLEQNQAKDQQNNKQAYHQNYIAQ